MTRVLVILWTGLCLFLLNSCAGLGIGLTAGVFGIHAYEEARVHRPDLKLKPIQTHIESVKKHISLPSINFISNQPADEENNKKTSATNSQIFGFDCSRLETKKNQSECFNEFSKALSQNKESQIKQKQVLYDKKNNPNANQKIKATTKNMSSRPNLNTSVSNQKLPSLYIESWVNSWQNKDLKSYFSFYSNEFKGMQNHRADWEASRQHALTKNRNISITVSNIQLQKEGNDKLKVNFTQNFKSDGFSDTGIKELILLKKGTDWKIVKESWIPKNPTIINKNSASRTAQINKKLTSWVRAWENGDVTTYLSFYSKKFKTSTNSHIEWLDSRHQALESKKNLNIKIRNLKITEKQETIEANFIQEFSSEKYSDVGIKELVWIKTEGSWKILKETWIPS
jgi:ketosteroid isomerase-like protein